MLAGLLITLSVALIVIRVESANRPVAAVPLPRISFPAAPLPQPYRPKWSAARAVRQAAKARPVLLGTPGAAEFTAYCADRDGAGSTATLSDGDWFCEPGGQGTPGEAKIDVGTACRFLYDDRAWPLRSTDDAQSWRCYRDGP